MTIRTLDVQNRFSQVSSVVAADRHRALHPGESLNILALSGGGVYGAFGAGAVAGLTRTGSRKIRVLRMTRLSNSSPRAEQS
jgi:predicted acylesterase/phospholipase RssA